MIYFNVIAGIIILMLLIALASVVLLSITRIEGYRYIVLVIPIIQILIFIFTITSVINILNTIF